MTAPITFPTLSPGAPPQQRDHTNERLQLLLSVMQSRQQLAMRREELALEAERTHANTAQSEQATAESKARVKQAEAQRKNEEDKLTAGEIASRHFSDLLTSGEGLTPANLNRIRLAAFTENKKLGALILSAIDALAQGAEKTRAEIAQRRTLEVNADVGEELKGAKVTAGKNDAARSGIQLDAARIDLAMAKMLQAGFDVARINTAIALAQHSGKTWGEARKTVGLPVIAGGLPDGMTFPTKATGAENNAAFAETVQTANAMINALGNKGLSPVAFRRLTGRGFIGGTIVGDVLQGALPDDQKELIAAYGGFIQPLNSVFIKGAASEGDVLRMLSAYVPLDSDNQATLGQKALMRNAIALSFGTADQTGYLAALAKFEELGKQYKISPALMAPFRAMKHKFAKADEQRSAIQSGTLNPNDAIINDVLSSARRP